MTKRILLFALACLLAGMLPAKTLVEPGGQAGSRGQGVLHVSGGWQNRGDYSPGNGTVRFFGALPDTIGGTQPSTFYNMIVDKPVSVPLFLDSEVVVEHTLHLYSGVLSSIVMRESSSLPALTEARYQPLGTRLVQQARSPQASRLLREDAQPEPLPPSRTGSLVLQDGAHLIVEEGSMTFAPQYAGSMNITYLSPGTTGPELDGTQTGLNVLRIDADGDVSLGQNAVVYDTLSIAPTSSFVLGSYTCQTGRNAVVDAYPAQINGTLQGEPAIVGTGNYNNMALGIALNYGNDIGNFETVLFLREASVMGAGISRRWQLASTNPPVDRQLALLWPSSADNGIDLSHVQAYRLSGSVWYAEGPPRDLSAAGSTRLYIVDEVDEFGEWTVAPSQFTLSDYELDFGQAAVGDSVVLSFTVYNDQPYARSGYVSAPNGFTVQEGGGRALQRTQTRVSRDEETRNYVYLNIPANGSQSFGLAFKPLSVSAYDTNVLIRYTGNGNPSRLLHVTGEGIAPQQMAISPQSLADTLQTGQSASTTVTVQNDGAVNLAWSAQTVAYTEVHSEGFESAFPPAGWSVDILQQADGWTQTASDTHTGSYAALADWHNVYDSRLVTTTFTVPAGGHLLWWIRSQDTPIYGGEFNVEITHDGGTNWDTLFTASQNSFSNDFAQRALDLSAYEGIPVQIGFRVWNNYWTNGVLIDDVTVASIPATSPGWLALDGGATTSGTALAGSASYIGVQLSAAGLADGSYSAAIEVTSDAPANPLQYMPVELQVATPGIAVSPDSIDFGPVVVGQSASAQFCICNTGTAVLNGSIVTPANFSVSTTRMAANQQRAQRQEDSHAQVTRNKHGVATRNTMLFNVNPGATAWYTVLFTPPNAGALGGSITIADNAPASDEEIAVLGTGIQLAALSTTAISNIVSETATGGGNVTNDGYSSITARGVCWGEQPDPTTAGSHTSDGTGTGAFSSSLTGLAPEHVYYVRAYAVNGAGTAYGNQVSFTTLPGSLNAPANLVLSENDGDITLVWSEVAGANAYLVFAASDPDGTWTNVTAQGTFGGAAGQVDWTASFPGEKMFFYVIATTTPAARQ